MNGDLIKLGNVNRMLAEVRDAKDAKKVSDVARAAVIYAKKAKLGKEAVDYAWAIHIDAKTLMGDFLAVMPKASRENRSNKSVLRKDTTLADIGIDKRESSEAQALSETKKDEPELHAKIRSGKAPMAAAKRHKKKKEYKRRVKKAQAEPVEMVSGPFDLILADPPWRYDDATPNREVENHYDTMPVADIEKDFKDSLSAKDCVLLLWATAPKLVEAMSVVSAWGFNYRTHAIWDKRKIGMGHWFRGQHELLLLAVRGKPKSPDDSELVSSIFSEARGKHSRKPECVYQWIEKAFPFAKKLERYCRNPRNGWAVEGNEVCTTSTKA